jgi:hypothetical protein
MLSTVTKAPAQSFTDAVQDAFSTIRLFKTNSTDGWQAVRRIPLSTLFSAATPELAKALLETHILSFLQHVGDTTDWLLSIPPLGSNGFAIDLSKSGAQYRVTFGQLEEQFPTLADALTWVARGMSDSYQLRVIRIGGRPREWALEPTAQGSNGPSLAAGDVVLFRALRSVETVVFSNTFKAN